MTRSRRTAVAAMTFATGVLIANNYYAQPLEATIAAAFHASSAAVGAVLTVIQLSYALGLALLVPLGDLLERRRLVVTMLVVTTLGQVAVAVSPTLTVLASAAAVVALTTVAAQILVPFAAHLAREGEQGKTISTVMSGLLVGVLLSRVVAGVVAQVLGWRAVFLLGAALTAVAGLALWRALPVLAPATRLRYPALLRSVLALVRDEPVLRSRIVYSASSYAAFGAVWTSIGFLLADRRTACRRARSACSRCSAWPGRCRRRSRAGSPTGGGRTGRSAPPSRSPRCRCSPSGRVARRSSRSRSGWCSSTRACRAPTSPTRPSSTPCGPKPAAGSTRRT